MSSNDSIQQPRKAVRVRFYRNGDSHYCGFQMALPPDRYRTFEALLDDLTQGPVCDRNILPKGVRFLFDQSTGRRVRQLQDLVDGGGYVCASFDQYKRLAYSASSGKQTAVRQQQQQQMTPSIGGGTGAMVSATSAAASARGRIAVILPGGGLPRPRRAARVLLNGRTAKSFDRVMADVSQAVRLASGAVRRLYSLQEKKLVTSLDDFFAEANVFVAYANEKMNGADFVLDEHDQKFINTHVKNQQMRKAIGQKAAFPDTPATVQRQQQQQQQERKQQKQQQQQQQQQQIDNESQLAEVSQEVGEGSDANSSMGSPVDSPIASSISSPAVRAEDGQQRLLSNGKARHQPIRSVESCKDGSAVDDVGVDNSETAIERLSDQMIGALVCSDASGCGGGGGVGSSFEKNSTSGLDEEDNPVEQLPV